MEQQVFDIVSSNGAWATLFVGLLLYTLKTNKDRESRYQATIKENQEVIRVLADKISVDVTEIKNKLK